MPTERYNDARVVRPATVSHAVRAGDQLYVGGVIGTDGPHPRLVAGGPAEQTEQALVNLRAVLAASGADLAHVVFVQMYLSEMSEFPVVEAVYTAVFGDLQPARATLGVQQLALGASVEFTCIAYLG